MLRQVEHVVAIGIGRVEGPQGADVLLELQAGIHTERPPLTRDELELGWQARGKFLSAKGWKFQGSSKYGRTRLRHRIISSRSLKSLIRCVSRCEVLNWYSAAMRESTRIRCSFWRPSIISQSWFTSWSSVFLYSACGCLVSTYSKSRMPLSGRMSTSNAGEGWA